MVNKVADKWDDKTPTRLSNWDITDDSVTLTDVEWPKPPSQPQKPPSPVQTLTRAEMLFFVMYKGMDIADVVKYASALKEKLNGNVVE